MSRQDAIGRTLIQDERKHLSWLLNTIYALVLVAASPWLCWRYLSAGKNRRGWSHKLWGRVRRRDSANRCIWFHAVSVGEVNLLAPVINQLRQLEPELEFVISTTTESGFDLARKKYPELYAFFCPMDFTWAIKRTLKRIRPQLLVLAELEVWPNLIQTTERAGIPVAVINGRLSANSFRGYQRLGWLIRKSFSRLSIVAAQSPTYARRFLELGCKPDCVVETGNVKFDGVETNRDNPRSRQLARLAQLNAEDQVFIAGSTQIEEDLMAASVYQQLSPEFPRLRLVLVPRHPERCGTLITRLQQMRIPVIRRSELKPDTNANPETTRSTQRLDAVKSTDIPPVVIVDVIGELGAWWGCADVTFVGGSLGRRGGQNMIEPAAFGLPVSFGPNTWNFRDIVEELLGHEAAIVVEDQPGMTSFVRQALENPDWATALGERASNVVIRHLGASQRTAIALMDLMASSTCTPEGVADTSRAA